jgi:hypothetical protein
MKIVAVEDFVAARAPEFSRIRLKLNTGPQQVQHQTVGNDEILQDSLILRSGSGPGGQNNTNRQNAVPKL